MLGVPKKLIEHALKVDSKAIPKKQRLRHFSPDKREAIKKELAKLLVTGFIKEVYHPEWLANPILVQKKNNKEWRMSVDYTDLNKHCPKDPFGLPRIDQVINSTVGCVLLSFQWSNKNPMKIIRFVTSSLLCHVLQNFLRNHFWFLTILSEFLIRAIGSYSFSYRSQIKLRLVRLDNSYHVG